MEIKMKDTLRALRQQKNVTQEALANHLGITPQSVGKWERGEGFPDITLLPNIALYFGVTIDDLLDVGQARIDEKIKSLEEESHRLKNAGENEKNLELWEKAYAEFPNDCRVMNGLMNAINREAIYPCPADKAERKIELGKRILAESTDQELREDAIQDLCYTYNSIGDKENALKYADMGGNLYTTRADLRASVLDGEEGIKANQQYLLELIQLAAMTASRAADDTPEAQIYAEKFAIQLWKLLLSDDSIRFYAHAVSYAYSCIARNHACLGDREKTYTSLDEMTRYAVMDAFDEEAPYTAPLVNRLINDPSASTKNFKGNACNMRLSGLKWNCYDFIREEERFKAIVAKLEEFAE